MNREQFFHIIEHPQGLTSVSEEDFADLLTNYPWFAAGQILFAMKLKQTGSIRFPLQLRKAAIYSSDRKSLRQKMNQVPAPGTAETDKKDSSDQEESLAELISRLRDELSKRMAEGAEETTTVAVGMLKEIVSSLENPEKPAEAQSATEPASAAGPVEQDEIIPDIRDYNFDHLQELPEQKKSEPSNKELIDRFIENGPTEKPANKVPFFNPVDLAKKSLEEPEMGIVTETLADIYVKQENYQRAIQAYERLGLLYPEKSSYFAARIEELRKKLK
ncbi:MAG: tetratricopeptide repeat protein [Bacteroidales bacterium]